MKSAGAWMTDCGASSEFDRALVATTVSSLVSFPRLPWLDGLVMSSISGDLISLSSSSLGGFSCASSSISVEFVPLLSTGEGSIWAG